MSVQGRPMRARARIDVAGMLLSGACALHCLLVALAPAMLAATGLGALLDESAEWAFTATAVGVGAIAALMAWRARRPAAVLVGFVLAIGALLAGRVLEHLGAHGATEALSVLGGVGLALTHVVNLRAASRAPRQPLARSAGG